MRRMPGDGVTLAVLDEGEGRPVLLLHGFPDSSYVWRYQVPALVEDGMRVIAPDLRGFGESDKPEAVEDYALSHSVADVVALLDGLGIERTQVVGHDWGPASPGCSRPSPPHVSTGSSRCRSDIPTHCERRRSNSGRKRGTSSSSGFLLWPKNS